MLWLGPLLPKPSGSTKQEAPQREVERQQRQESDARAAQEKARLTNKPPFRP
jgi:hypothetical protein